MNKNIIFIIVYVFKKLYIYKINFYKYIKINMLNDYSLLKTWSPIVYLHSKEKYFPCSSDWLLKNSTLVDYTTNPITKISPVNNKDLYDNAKLHEFKKNEDNTLILSFNEDLYPGEIPISNVPCYGYISRFEDKIFLRYVFLYPNNGAYSILGLREIGQHPGIDENDIDVDFFNNYIVIKGERKCLSLQEEILKRKQEIYYGSFERKILIPFSVTSDQSVSIKMENGFLIININKKMELTNRFTLKPKKEKDDETKL